MNQLTNLSPADISAQHEQDAKDLTRILPASKKVYVQGSRPDIQVPFREISLTETPTGLGGEYNPQSWYMTHLGSILIQMYKLI